MVFAIVHACGYQFAFGPNSPDKSYQIAAARSFLEGNGFTYTTTDTGDLSDVRQEPLVGWPPGYAAALALLLWTVGSLRWSAVLLDWLSVCLFVLSWFVILRTWHASVTPGLRVLVWAYWGLVYVPCDILTSPELLALALFSLAVASALQAFRTHVTMWPAILSGLLLVAAGAVRFAYWPLLVVIPGAYGACALRWGGRFLRDAIVSLGVVLVGLLLVASYQKHLAGHVTYLTSYYDATPRGLNWSHLVRLYPFPMAALGVDTLMTAVIVKLGLHASWRQLLWIPSLIVVAALAEQLARRWVDRGRTATARAAFFLQLAVAMTLIISVSMIAYLSVRYPALENSWTLDGLWTYGDESRYFAPLLPALLVAVVAQAHRSGSAGQGWFVVSPRVVWPLLIVSVAFAGSWRAYRWTAIAREGLSPSAWAGRYVAEALPAVERLASASKRRRASLVYVDTDRNRSAVARVAGVAVLPSLDGVELRRPCSGRCQVLFGLSPSGPPERLVQEFCAIHGCRRVAALDHVELVAAWIPGGSR